MAFRLRPATLDDAEFLFALRTDPVVVAASNGTPPASLGHQTLWLEKTLGDPDRLLFIIEAWAGLPSNAAGRPRPAMIDGTLMGQCRLDLIDFGRAAEVSIALRKEVRGYGLGTEILWDLARRANDLGIRWLEAVIKETNLASRKAFLKAGYSVEEIKDGLVHMGYKCGS